MNCIQERHGRAKGVSGWISSARAGSKGRDDRDRNDRDTVVVDSSAQAPKIGIEHSMELVGRNFEVSAIRDALRAAGSGRGVTLMISGELGIGKTRLAGVVADLAAGQKMVVLTGRASPSGSAPALWPWYQVLAGRPERDMLPSAADAGAVGEGLRARWEALARAAAALASSSAGTATVIILEDMHWADDSSLQLLQACAGLPGLMVAVTFRGPEAFDKLREPVAAMRAIPGTTSLMLHPWTSVEVAEVARHVDRSWVPLLVDGSGGIPLVVGEMLRALEEAGLGSTGVMAAGGAGTAGRHRQLSNRRTLRVIGGGGSGCVCAQRAGLADADRAACRARSGTGS